MAQEGPFQPTLRTSYRHKHCCNAQVLQRQDLRKITTESSRLSSSQEAQRKKGLRNKTEGLQQILHRPIKPGTCSVQSSPLPTPKSQKQSKMSKNQLRNQANFQPVLYKVNDTRSMTIPEMTMTVKEILERFSKGLPFKTGQEKVPIYHGDKEFFPDPGSLDLVDRQIMREYAIEQINLKRKQLKDESEYRRNAEQKKFEAYKKAKMEGVSTDTTDGKKSPGETKSTTTPGSNID